MSTAARRGCASGSAPIARVVATGEEIYARKLRFAEAVERIERLYRPYHRALKQLVAATREKFRLLSAGRLPLDAVLDRAGRARRPARRADIVLGDCHGTACHPVVIEPRISAARARLYRGAQRALCRRLHHRALRQAACRRARAPDRIEPQPLHGRARFCAQPFLRGSPPTCATCWRRSPPSTRRC